MQTTTEIIVEYKVATKSESNAWEKLVAEVHDLDFGASTEKLSKSEEEFMELYYYSDARAKKKNGDWRKTYCLPKPYLSAKSVVLRAKSLGVSLTDAHASVYGKSYIEKQIQKAKTTTVVNEQDKLLAHVYDINRILGSTVSITERERYITLIRSAMAFVF